MSDGRKKNIWICELVYVENGNERGQKQSQLYFEEREKKKKQPQGMGALGFLEKGTQVIYDHKLVLLAGLSAL